MCSVQLLCWCRTLKKAIPRMRGFERRIHRGQRQAVDSVLLGQKSYLEQVVGLLVNASAADGLLGLDPQASAQGSSVLSFKFMRYLICPGLPVCCEVPSVLCGWTVFVYAAVPQLDMVWLITKSLTQQDGLVLSVEKGDDQGQECR